MPKAQATKVRLDKWDNINLKNICASKDTFNKLKRQTVELEIIFTDHVADKGLISEYIKKSYSSITSTTKTSNNLIKI